MTPAAMKTEIMKGRLNWDRIKMNVNGIITIFSTNDPYVPYQDSEIYEKKLNAKIISEQEKKHMGSNIAELPSALDAVLALAGETE